MKIHQRYAKHKVNIKWSIVAINLDKTKDYLNVKMCNVSLLQQYPVETETYHHILCRIARCVDEIAVFKQ